MVAQSPRSRASSRAVRAIGGGIAVTVALATVLVGAAQTGAAQTGAADTTSAPTTDRPAAPTETHTATDPAADLADPAARGKRGRWKQAGPNSQAGWSITFPSDPDRIVVAPYMGACLAETKNRGETWHTRCRVPVVNGTFYDLELNRANEDQWFAIVDALVYVTNDGGKHWTDVGLPVANYWDVDVSADGSLVVAGAKEQSHVSRDGGATWTALPVGASGLSTVAVGNGSAYFATPDGLVAVRDLAGSPTEPVVVHEGSVDSVTADDEAVALLSGDATAPGVFVSRDDGASWTNVRPDLRFSSIIELVDGDLFLEDDELLRGSDYGTTWTTYPDAHPSAVTADAGLLGDQVYVSEANAGTYLFDGATFNRVGVPGAITYDLAVAADKRLLAGTHFDVYDTDRPIKSFEWGLSGGEGSGFAGNQTAMNVVTSPDGQVAIKSKIPSSISYALYRSTDGGRTWAETFRAFGSEGRFHSVFIHPGDPNLVYAGYESFDGHGFLVSTDGGSTWTDRATPALASPILAITGSPADPRKVWIGGADGLAVSTDAGETFTKIASTPVTTLAVPDTDPNRLLVGSDAGVWWSADGGATLIAADLPGDSPVRVTDIAFQPGRADSAALTSGSTGSERGLGVLRTKDGGETWKKFSKKLRDKNANALVFSDRGGRLFVATEHGGVFWARFPR